MILTLVSSGFFSIPLPQICLWLWYWLEIFRMLQDSIQLEKYVHIWAVILNKIYNFIWFQKDLDSKLKQAKLLIRILINIFNLGLANNKGESGLQAFHLEIKIGQVFTKINCLQEGFCKFRSRVNFKMREYFRNFDFSRSLISFYNFGNGFSNLTENNNFI